MMKYFILVLLFLNYGCKSQEIQKRIVLVNVDTLGRKDIARVISAINEAKPKVVAIDLHFVDNKGAEDLMLINALNGCKNLVMSSMINYLGSGVPIVSNMSSTQFMPAQSRSGFVNVLQEEDEFNTVKRFIVSQKTFNGKVEYHFSVRTAMSYDSLKAVRFIGRHNTIAEVDYKQGKRRFKIISSDIVGNIVIIGFLGPGDEDMFYTPLNSNKKPNEPDMYGAEYLANIVAQILE
jgi:CHASE2 domain-containing sensor protein